MPEPLTRITIAAVCICFGSLMQSSRAQASDFSAAAVMGAFSLSLNYSGAGIKYYTSDSFALEAKGQSDGDVTIGGLRLYEYFRTADRMFLFLGLEADYIDFRGETSRGAGGAGELFCGFEYFISPNVSIQADFGPAYIYLKDRHNPVSVGGVEYVANFGFNVHLGGGKAFGAGQTKTRKTRSRARNSDSGGPWLIY